MGDVSWIKLYVQFFDDLKIKRILKSPTGHEAIVVWVYLLTQAGKCNSNGYIYITQNIPMVPEDIAMALNLETSTVSLALKMFEELDMAEVDEDGKIYLSNFSERQSLDKMERQRALSRERQRRFKDRHKEDLKNNEVTQKVTQDNATEKRREEKKRKEEEKNKKYLPLAELLYEHRKFVNDRFLAGKNKKQTFLRWANDIRMLCERDKAKYEDVRAVIIWCHDPKNVWKNGGSWSRNVLSGAKLRKHFDTMFEQMQDSNRRQIGYNKNWNGKYSGKFKGAEL